MILITGLEAVTSTVASVFFDGVSAADPNIDGLNALVGSQFVALVLSLVANTMLWRAWSTERMNRDEDRIRQEADAKERWGLVDKMADAQREQNSLTGQALSLASKRGNRE